MKGMFGNPLKCDLSQESVRQTDQGAESFTAYYFPYISISHVNS